MQPPNALVPRVFGAGLAAAALFCSSPHEEPDVLCPLHFGSGLWSAAFSWGAGNAIMYGYRWETNSATLVVRSIIRILTKEASIADQVGKLRQKVINLYFRLI